jgi:DNA-directed RNA polymerase subunit H (RpoH/RPB5)
MSTNTENKQKGELWELFKIRKTVIQTLKDRQYQIPKGINDLPFSDFVTLHKKNRHHLYFPTIKIPEIEGPIEEDRKGVLVYFESFSDFTKKLLETRVSSLDKEYPNLARLFFVLKISTGKKKPKVNAFVTNALKSDYSHVRILENIYQFDFMENIVLPKFTLLTTEERDNVVKFYKTNLLNFKKILVTDPVSKRFGARVNDMFYIERDGGKEYDFKVVVPENIY